VSNIWNGIQDPDFRTFLEFNQLAKAFERVIRSMESNWIWIFFGERTGPFSWRDRYKGFYTGNREQILSTHDR